MSIRLRPTLNAPSDPPTAVPPLSPAEPLATSLGSRVPRTRTGAAWLGICVAAVLFVVLIVFMLENTSRVQVSFVGMHGNLPLAMALLVAAVGSAILTMVIGAARITQLRRLSRRQRR
ncbi:lipopolysaccharide assembly LapA domain-containing protein [Actinoplanes sp. NPDC049681]|uniref:lipopolysaccharide assembly LapA domain-containing protein n=1 Tax=Actinoplanes sp. NPDC049681 TaxID=3363905 RepID=UPI0037BA1B3D